MFMKTVEEILANRQTSRQQIVQAEDELRDEQMRLNEYVLEHYNEM